MEYSIQEVAKAAGTTSRTLRHYDAIGLVSPVRIGANGYRYYDDQSLLRLQRVLLLKELGLGLDAIARVLEAQDARGASPEGATHILESHLDLLQRERDRVTRQISAVERTIAALSSSAQSHTNERKGLMAEHIFDGFDHTQYREEVEERWGADAYAKSDAWWRALGTTGQQEWKERLGELNSAWIDAAASGVDPSSDVAQALAARHVAWLDGVPGTPRGEQLAGYLLGLGEMYVADERFAANYGGVDGASLVRDALRCYVETHLSSH